MTLPDMSKLMIKDIITISLFIFFFRDYSIREKRRMADAESQKRVL